jgi:HSP20 family molecular chaperone IbpA
MFCFRRHTDILPLIDIFDTPNAYVLHVDAPVVRADDLCANWEPETRNVRVTGLLRRHGDEVFLETRYGPEERLVGPFKRLVRLPGESGVVEAAISWRMEEGIWWLLFLR